MQFNSPNIYYLEDVDFGPNYNLQSNVINTITGKPFFTGLTIVMVQGDYCGYCTKFKPHFQRVADELTHYGIEFATIQIDGRQPGERIFQNDQALTRILKRQLEGVPLVLKFYRGTPIEEYYGDHSYGALKKWVTN